MHLIVGTPPVASPTVLAVELETVRNVALVATVAVIVLVKSVVAYGIVRLGGHDNATALTISAALAQIGEFSFILVTLGLSLAILPEMARDLVVAGAMVSIIINPFLFKALDWHLRPVPAA